MNLGEGIENRIVNSEMRLTDAVYTFTERGCFKLSSACR